MPDIVMSAVVTRTLLGLPDLNINDGQRYQCSPTFLGATVSYTRNQVTSAWIDGANTVSRSLQMVTEQIAVEVFGRSATGSIMTAPQLQANEAELIAAFCQDNFTLTVNVDSATYAYQCESSDFQRLWTGPRQVAKQGQVVFSMPRQPVPVLGGV